MFPLCGPVAGRDVVRSRDWDGAMALVQGAFSCARVCQAIRVELIAYGTIRWTVVAGWERWGGVRA